MQGDNFTKKGDHCDGRLFCEIVYLDLRKSLLR